MSASPPEQGPVVRITQQPAHGATSETAGSWGRMEAVGRDGGAGASGSLRCCANRDGKSPISLITHQPLREAALFRRQQNPSWRAGAPRSTPIEMWATRSSRFRLRGQHCFWGDIGEPGGERYALAKLTLKTDFNDFVCYNIGQRRRSQLGWVSTVAMPQCATLTRAETLLADCPAEGQLPDKAGNLICCYSAPRDKNSVVAVVFCP